jgi:hypothetical protein
MTKNKEIAEIVFKAIAELGYKPYDIEYGNGYFLFEMGEDSVVHFRLKGLGLLGKHWKFGMWITSEYLEESYREKEKDLSYDNQYNVVQLFAQYDTNIDKFKPSRSSLCITYKASEWEELLKYQNPWWDLKSMLGMMKKHPLMCYAGMCGEDAGYYSGSCLYSYIKYEGYNKWQELKETVYTMIFLSYTKLKVAWAKNSKIIHSLTLYDFEKENKGWSTNYKYQVKPVFKKDTTDKQISKWFEHWFRKDTYGNYDRYHCVIKANECWIEGNNRPFIMVEED